MKKRFSKRKTKILLVDDSVLDRELIALFLRKNDFEVESAGSRFEALNITKSWKPKLSLVSLDLVNDNSFSLVESLRKLNPNIPLIALSSSRNSKTQVASMQIGMRDYIAKPFSMIHLLQIVSHYSDSSVSGYMAKVWNIEERIADLRRVIEPIPA